MKSNCISYAATVTKFEMSLQKWSAQMRTTTVATLQVAEHRGGQYNEGENNHIEMIDDDEGVGIRRVTSMTQRLRIRRQYCSSQSATICTIVARTSWMCPW